MTRHALIHNGPREPRSRLAFRVLAQADDRAEVLIYDEIGENWWGEGVSAKRFTAELSAIEAAHIDVRINSVGGSVFEGNAIYNALERHPARVETHIDGIAASIASIIALAGERVHIAENAFLMIHNPHGVAFGEAKDMRKMADTLDTVRSSLVGTYAKRTGKSAEDIQAWMDAETWFAAAEALEHGFVDEITESKEIDARIAASAAVANFSNMPPALLEQLRAAGSNEPAPVDPEPTEARTGPAPEVVAVWAESQRILLEAAR